MKGLPYFCWYPADAEIDDNFRQMDFAGKGFYLSCLNYAWANGGIPRDPEKRARALNTTRAIADRLWKQVEPCFIPDPERGSVFINERLEEERGKAILRHLRGQKGAKGKLAQALLKQNLSPAKNLDQAAARAYDSDSSEEVKPSNEEKPSMREKVDCESLFERLYAAHPKKSGKILGEQALVELLTSATEPAALARRIEESHRAWLPEFSRDGGKFAPALHRWLKDGGFEDDPPNNGEATNYNDPKRYELGD